MKRPRPIPELPTPPRRKRSLSEEERALWESVAKQIKPLRKKPRAAKAAAGGGSAGSAETRRVHATAAACQNARARQNPSRRTPPPLAPLGRRERSQLSRGRKEIDARLDLHGMTQTRAHRALSGFLQRAHHDGLTFVLIITGKGKHGRRIRARRAAPPGAAMAEPARIPRAGGRL